MKAKLNLVLALILSICTANLVIVGSAHGDWNVESSPTTVTLYDIWGISQSDIYAVGEQETILHNDGTSWSVVSSVGNGDPLRDVSGNSGSNVYAVGDRGKIRRYTASWNDVTDITTTTDLNGVWVSAGGEVFIVGKINMASGQAIIIHRDGSGNWSVMPSGTTNTLEAVWGSSESDVFAVGANGTILHYDGFEWLSMTSNTSNYLTCVWGSASNDVFASGTTNVHHYNGSAWTPTSGVVEYPDDLWGSSGSDVYAVGGSDFRTIDHFDGTTWGTQFQPGDHPNGVWGSSKDNVFVVGNSGMIMRYRSGLPQGASFSTQSIISITAGTAFSVYAADIDNDGDMDVLSASDDDNTVAWYENTDGSGTFSAPRIITDTAVGARSVFADDMDSDGDVDVLSASWGVLNSGSNPNMEVAWYENAPDTQPLGSFISQQAIAYHTAPISVISADLDNDGDPDVLSASYGDNAIAWNENLDGLGKSWSEHIISNQTNGPWDVFAADLDNDGDLDVLAASNFSDDVAWFENRLNEVSTDFGPLQLISDIADGARVVRAADMDRDGDMDVISASWFDGKVAWYPNLGGTFGNPATNQNVIAVANTHTQAMHVVDLDNDGDVDVLYGSWEDGVEHKILWMENMDGSGSTWSSHEISTLIIGCQSLYTADLDGDGDLDVLSASQDDDKIAWYENLGGSANKPPFPPPIDGPLDEANFGELDPIDLYGGTYSDPESDQHDLTHFQVWRADSNVMIINETLSGGVTDYPISPGTIPSGLKYNWRVGYVDAFGGVSWSETYAFKIGTPEVETLPGIIAGADVGDFGMISIVHWPDKPSPKAVFGIDYDPRNYRIGTYDALNSRYIEFGNNLEMEPGRSYWILAREGLTINFSGIPVSQAFEVYVALDYNSNTSNGWNMVAPPNGTYYWGDVRVVEAIDGTLVDRGAVQGLADDNLYIDRRLWRWENGHYHSNTPDTDPLQVMAVYAGYWVKARQANVFLRFDPGAQISSLGLPEILMAGIWKKTQTWFSNLNIFSNEAVAEDDDTPPMPMGGLDDNSVDPVFQGCFIEITSDFN